MSSDRVDKLVYTEVGIKSYELDYPPAKALALGVKAEVSIFVEEAVLSKAAITVKA